MPRNRGTSRKGKPKKSERESGMGRALTKAYNTKSSGSSGKDNYLGGGRYTPNANGSSKGPGGMMKAPDTNDIGFGDNGGSGSDNLTTSTTTGIGGGGGGAGKRGGTTPGMESILEMDGLTDFLTCAKMAGREFESVRERFAIVDNNCSVAEEVPTVTTIMEDGEDIVGGDRVNNNNILSNISNTIALSDNHFSSNNIDEELPVPKRPPWTSKTTPMELDEMERDSFLNWRRSLAEREEYAMRNNFKNGQDNEEDDQNDINNFYYNNPVTITPFEKNLQVWRQLWRVIERSKVVITITDARDPLFYLSSDLRQYVLSFKNSNSDEKKSFLIIINKSDFLSKEMRLKWSLYFDTIGVSHVFFSAKMEQERLDELERDKTIQKTMLIDGGIVDDEMKMEDGNDGNDENDENDTFEEDLKQAEAETEEEEEISSTNIEDNDMGIQKPLGRQSLIHFLRTFAKAQESSEEVLEREQLLTKTATTTTSKKTNPAQKRTSFGLVGYPNVGKSSVVNVLIGSSKNKHDGNRVAVAARPGKTRHLQTLFVPDEDDLTIVDCPGLVFPKIVRSKDGSSEMIANGVCPLSVPGISGGGAAGCAGDRLLGAVGLVCKRIPKFVFEDLYGMKFPSSSFNNNGGGGGGSTEMVAKMQALKDAAINNATSTTTMDDYTDFVDPTDLLETYAKVRGLYTAGSGNPDVRKSASVILGDYTRGTLLYCREPPGSLQREYHLRVRITNNIDNGSVAITTEDVGHDESLSLVDNDKVHNGGGDDDNGDDVVIPNKTDLDFDIDILDAITLGGSSSATGDGGGALENRGKKHKSMKKWGKKQRKTRNKDPYGCYSDPDSVLISDTTTSTGTKKTNKGNGIIVNAGKYGRNGYTRPDYAGARSAITFSTTS